MKKAVGRSSAADSFTNYSVLTLISERFTYAISSSILSIYTIFGRFFTMLLKISSQSPRGLLELDLGAELVEQFFEIIGAECLLAGKKII